MTPLRQLAVFMAIVLCLTACTPAQINKAVATLDTVASSATGLVVVCTGIEAAAMTNPAIAGYVSACVLFGQLLAKGANLAATDLAASNKSPAEKSTEIVADLTAAIQAQPGAVPAGLPSNIVAAINTASNALDTFLKTLGPATSAKSLSAKDIEAALHKLHAAGGLSRVDHSKLAHVHSEYARATATVAKFHAAHPAN